MRARPLFPVAALALSLACRSELKRTEAESVLRAQYPVDVLIKLPVKASAAKGSIQAAELASLKAAAEKSGWFTIQWTEEKDRVTVALLPTSAAPKDLTPTANGFLAPVAKAAFVQSVSGQTRGDEAHATYRVRLEQPTALFPLFELKHPGVHIGATKDRHAIFRRTDGKWLLASTDEKYHKPE
jgi:hypothetical protein